MIMKCIVNLYTDDLNIGGTKYTANWYQTVLIILAHLVPVKTGYLLFVPTQLIL